MPTLDEIKNKVIEVWESDHIILPSVTAAQFILESASGNSTLANATNNLFGIKASPPWSGEVYYHETNEEVDKSLLKVTDGFRKYATWQESVQDHSNFFISTETRKKVYAKVIGETDYTKVCEALTGTYATDSSYGEKLNTIIKAKGLDAWDKTEGETKMVKVYISPSSQQDNVGVGNFGTEEMRMNQIADVVESELKRLGIITLRNDPSMDITQMVAASNAFGADVHLAIHSNAGGGTGAEAYYYTGSASSQALATAVYNNLTPMTPTGDRGVKATTQLYEVWATNAVATLVEVAFHDNATDAAFILNNIQSIGIALAKGVCTYLGVNFGTASAATVAPKPVASPTVTFSGQAHIQSKGWVEMANNTIGTIGESLRLEAFSLVVKNKGIIQPMDGVIHVQDIGDVGYQSGTNIFGTVGQEKRLEAVKINVGNGVQYRAHIENLGWSVWVRSGEWVGTTGKSLRIEAIEFRVA